MNVPNYINRSRWVFLGLFLLWGFTASACGNELGGNSNSVATLVKVPDRDWKKFINECISRVEKSDAVFYRRGERVSGKEVAQQMREYMKVVLRVKSVPDPFGRNAGILLAMMTTHEGIARDGITGNPEPIEVVIQGKRIKLYDWLKHEFGIDILPGDEPGHEVFAAYEAEIKPELLVHWERYIDNCIKVAREANGVTFYLKDRVASPTEVATLMEGNRSNAVRVLKFPDIEGEKERYEAGWILLTLTRVPLPKRESFADQEQYGKAVDKWAMGLNWAVKSNGSKEFLATWVENKAGESPPMPKLKKIK